MGLTGRLLRESLKFIDRHGVGVGPGFDGTDPSRLHFFQPCNIFFKAHCKIAIDEVRVSASKQTADYEESPKSTASNPNEQSCYLLKDRSSTHIGKECPNSEDCQHQPPEGCDSRLIRFVTPRR